MLAPPRILAAGLVATGLMFGMAPVALASPVTLDNPVPGPEPMPVPAPEPATPDSSMCQNGEVMHNGNCVPNMTPADAGVGEEATPEAPLRVTDDQTTSAESGVPADLVPSLDGSPCTGDWMSGACYAESMDPGSPVVPKSTLSSSP